MRVKKNLRSLLRIQLLLKFSALKVVWSANLKNKDGLFVLYNLTDLGYMLQMHFVSFLPFGFSVDFFKDLFLL